MRTDDYAILVGISEYSHKSFRQLKSPPNDVKRMQQWLLKPNGGNLPPDNVKTIITPLTSQSETPANDWKPNEHDFKSEFRTIVTQANGEPVRRPQGRLYLYFSAHGFSERRDQNIQAAVFAANATRFFANNICGTFYALAAKEQALFGEIVLIMDCCRDSELNLPFSKPAINSGVHDDADEVRLVAVYAAPKGDKAEEREFPEIGMTCGLLTHALLKSLDETFPDSATAISSTALKRHLLGTWAQVCGDEPAPEPEFIVPTRQDITFPIASQWLSRTFVLSEPLMQRLEVEIFNARRELVVRCVLTPEEATQSRPGQPDSELTFQNGRFRLKLQQGFYRWVVSGDLRKSGTFELPGVEDVVL